MQASIYIWSIFVDISKRAE